MADTRDRIKTVVVFGDSITEAKDLPEKERFNAWVDVVERQSANAFKMINEGKGGRPTDAMLEFQAMLQRQSVADLLVLALGGNDARDVSGTCVANAFRNLKAMITLAREHYGKDLKILLVAPTNINKDALGPSKPIAGQREANLQKLGAVYVPLAREENCFYVSLYGSLSQASLILDGVHPDSAGHRAIADIMGRAIADALSS